MRSHTAKKLIWLTAAVAMASFGLDCYRLSRYFSPTYVYDKDFAQFYWMGKACQGGSSIYAPLPEIASRFESKSAFLSHASAYPPSALLIGLPLSYLKYQTALLVWCVIEAACILAAILLAVKEFGGSQAKTAVIITALLFPLWRPVHLDLFYGQIMGLLLLLLTGAWLALRSKRFGIAGLLLGVVLCLKLYAWPILLLLLLKGRVEAALTAGCVVLAAHITYVALLGWSTVFEYYTTIGPSLELMYRGNPVNFSAFATGARLFGSSGGFVCSMVTLLAFLVIAVRADPERGFLIMLVASVILAPIAWVHYFVTLFPCLALAANRHFQRYELPFVALALLIATVGFKLLSLPAPPAYASAMPLLLIVFLTWALLPAKSVTGTRYEAELLCS